MAALCNIWGRRVVDELDSDHQAAADIGTTPATAAHPEFEANGEIRQTHPVLADFRNSFFTQMCSFRL